ncbi:ABC transporter permease [Rhodoligotrophos ferricapiens]|uniref:ABC transporter permease n=1 Tax=Rhodoligotrophos ferricapiens TaxID=3069264 RepID=UPI00315DCD9A
MSQQLGHPGSQPRSSLPHYVSREPFNPYEAETLSPAQERIYLASGWRMMWWKLKRHKVAVASGIFLLLMYLSIPFTEFLAPYNSTTRHANYLYAPPQTIHFFHDGEFIGPFVYGYDSQANLETFRWDYSVNHEKVYPLRFFCHGDPYELFDMVPGSLHLVCPAEGGVFFPLGTDRLGRDMLSRIIYGTRISLTVGLIGITISFILGITLGGMAGYFGGWIDASIQRVIEILRSLPELPLWLALSAALPVTWSPIVIYFGITIILGLLDWPGLARSVRSKFLALREEDFTTAAVLMGAKPSRVIGRHLVPNFMSHLIASATLSVPAMILGETALSFLGLGLRPPITSWGVLLNEAQNLAAIEFYPWIITPMVPVILVILAFNFLGDGLRDAADPYH